MGSGQSVSSDEWGMVSSSSGSDAMQDIGSDVELHNPGTYQTFSQGHSLSVDDTQGLQLTLMQPVYKQHLLLQHGWFLSPMNNGYMGVLIADTSNKGTGMKESMVAMLRRNYQNILTARFTKSLWCPETEMEGEMHLNHNAFRMGNAKITHKGDDFTATLSAGVGQNNQTSLTYLQSITKDLALGAEASFNFDNLTWENTFQWIYGLDENTQLFGSHARIAKEKTRTNTDIYVRREAVPGRLRLFAHMNAQTEGLNVSSSAIDFGAEAPIRIEEGGHPYTTLKAHLFPAQLDSIGQLKDFKLVTAVEHALLQGRGQAIVSLSMDPSNNMEPYKLGLQVNLQGTVPEIDE